jgi:segregation and condensation protein B
MQKLLEKELIVIVGRNEDAVGKPLLYATSKNFMDYLGINSPAELPQLKDITNIDIVIPTNASEAVPEEASSMVVMEDGSILHTEIAE